jgi:hypothetical protein
VPTIDAADLSLERKARILAGRDDTTSHAPEEADVRASASSTGRTASACS